MAIQQISCPYCGAQVTLPQKILSRSFSFPIKHVGLNLSHTLITREFSLSCPFCGKNYQYIEMGNVQEILKLTMSISDSVIEWLNKWNIDLEDLIENGITGIVIPKDFIVKRLKYKLKGVRLLNICFKVERGGMIYRGFLVGHLYREPYLRIEVFNASWLIPPKG